MKSRNVALYITFLCVSLLSGLFLGGCKEQPSARVLSKNAIRTDASNSSVGAAMSNVYEEMRLIRYLNSEGVAVFPDGTSTDSSYNETAARSGAFLHHQLSFGTSEGKTVSINFYREDDRDGLILWEYRGGDPQEVSQHLQIALGKSGVTSE